jgi:hypothetical protein
VGARINFLILSILYLYTFYSCEYFVFIYFLLVRVFCIYILFTRASILYLYTFYSCEYFVFIYFCFSHACVFGKRAGIALRAGRSNWGNRAKSHKKGPNSILGYNPSKAGLSSQEGRFFKSFEVCLPVNAVTILKFNKKLIVCLLFYIGRSADILALFMVKYSNLYCLHYVIAYVISL